jgi:hypothetical protein
MHPSVNDRTRRPNDKREKATPGYRAGSGAPILRRKTGLRCKKKQLRSAYGFGGSASIRVRLRRRRAASACFLRFLMLGFM